MKYLSNRGGRWLCIAIAAFILIINIALIRSMLNKGEFHMLIILLPSAFIYLLCNFSSVSYDRQFIYVQNLLYSRKYTVDQLTDLWLVSTLAKIYGISFSDGKEYWFTVGSTRTLNTIDLSEESAKMKRKLNEYMIPGTNSSQAN